MNLVAKEFVAARDDEDGVLILSTFAGAARELVEALLVNPYDVRETAAAIVAALGMPRDQRRKRMQLMRRTVAENNVLPLGRTHADRHVPHPAATAARRLDEAQVTRIAPARSFPPARSGRPAS